MKLLLCMLSGICYLYGQSDLPTITASSEIIDIKVGNDIFLKNGWHLDPSSNPDVFSIGSKWNYTSKKVTFITDNDSISFDVAPDRQYNFVVLLNEKTPCHIQIATSANPYFMQLKILIPIAVIFLTITFFSAISFNFLCALGHMKGRYLKEIAAMS